MASFAIVSVFLLAIAPPVAIGDYTGLEHKASLHFAIEEQSVFAGA